MFLKCIWETGVTFVRICLSFSHRLEYFQNFRLQSIMGEGWVQPESDLWRGKHWAFQWDFTPFFSAFLSLFPSLSPPHTHTLWHTPLQKGNSTNTHWRRTKGNQSLLVNDVEWYDKKYVISSSERVSLHTHQHKHTCTHSHTHTHRKVFGRHLKLPWQSVTCSGYTADGGKEFSLWLSAPV